jgi:hypothetical protein
MKENELESINRHTLEEFFEKNNMEIEAFIRDFNYTNKKEEKTDKMTHVATD